MDAAKKVLVVDDEPDVRLFIESCLLRAGFRVVGAANAEEAIRVLRVELPDLVVTDVMMPGESGYSLCRRIRDEPRGRDVPIVVATVLEAEGEAAEAGATAFLSKPFSERQLVKTVTELLHPGGGPSDLLTALAHLRAKELDRAVEIFQRLVERQPDEGTVLWARYYLAHVHQRRGDVDRAFEQLHAILARDPHFWRAHNRLGSLFEAAGAAPLAAKHFQRSLQENPEQPEVRARLAELEKKR